MNGSINGKGSFPNEIREEFKKFLETNENENTVVQTYGTQ